MSRPLVYLAATLLIVACTDQTDVSAPESEPADEAGQTASPLELSADRIPGGAHTALSGGATTVFDATANAFSLAAPNLAGEAVDQHERGDEDFEDAFEPGPGAEHSGLGPVFDNVSCEGCHEGDGRGRPPRPGEEISSLLFRASVSGVGAHGGPLPVPGFGGQLQLRSIPGYTPEVQAAISYVETQGVFTDGTPFPVAGTHLYADRDCMRPFRPASSCRRAWLRPYSGSDCSKRCPRSTFSRWRIRETATTTASPGG